MEKTQNEILTEILEELSAVRTAMNSIESKLARLNIEDPAPLDIELGDDELPVFGALATAAVAEEPVAEKAASEPEAEAVAEQPAAEEAAAEEPAAVEIEEAPTDIVELADDEDLPEDDFTEDLPEDDDDMPMFLEEPTPAQPAQAEVQAEPASVQEEEASPEEPEVELDIFGMPVVSVNERLGSTRSRSVAEKMEVKDAWRTAIPGSAVKDVRSAISLNDRVLFIRDLFGGDAEAFQNAMDRINGMHSLEEMVEYAGQEHPDWDLNSQTCYRLMMAVRRKLASI